MNQRKILSTAILLVLTGSAWGIENPEYKGTPYGDISKQKLKLFNENTNRTGQIGKKEVDFFEILNNAPDSKNPFPIADVELEFSCPQAETGNAYFGWYISIWKHFDNTNKPDEYLKGYNDVLSGKCKDKFSMLIEQNDYENEGENKVASYYVGIQSACVAFPDTTILRQYYPIPDSDLIKNQSCDTSDYKLKLGLIPKEIIADTSTLTESELKNSTPLGAIETGRIKLATDNNIYSVETYSTTDTAGTNDVPLLFSCTAEAARRTNDWKLTVYDDKNTIVAGYPRFINGSDCGSTFVDDKGGFKFTLPKDSPRYFVSVQSACDSRMKKECPVDTSPYNIARDVTKIYTSVLATGFKADATKFTLNRCGLNSSSTLSVTTENITGITLKKNKTPIKIQIGTMACQVLTQQSFDPTKDIMLGNITGNAEIIDAPLIAKDSATVTLGECVSSDAKDVKSKITLTGTKLDLENLNPSSTTPSTTDTATTAITVGAATTATTSNNSVVIPVKVDIGDFHCEGKDAFYIDTDKPKIGDKTYSLVRKEDIAPSIITPYSKISTEKFSELSVANRLEAVDKVDYYRLTTSPEKSTSLDFSCTQNKAIGSENGWVVTVWEQNVGSADWLEAAYSVMPTDCGNNGAFKMTVPNSKNSQYIGVQTSCLPPPDDSKSELNLDSVKTCKVNTSTYSISPTIVPTPFDSAWLTTKKNLGALSQNEQINSRSDLHVYQVDTGTTDANLTFSCLNAVRYQNDWKMLIYDSAKTLKSTTLINGSSCGIGQIGDTGAYPITLTKDSPTYYVVVKSACETNDSTCTVDSSNYEIKRITAAQAAVNEAAKPCFGAGCTTTTKVKPFFK